jgi:protein-L-isoaspartate(D-aspartate) O-methyltransferase
VKPGARLARTLTTQGAITDPAWHRAALAVPREEFVPATVWGRQDDGWYSPLCREDPNVHRWMGQDVSLVTQVDDGRPTGPDGRGRTPSSSLSQPSLVLAMLEALDATQGMRVLEIGTGSGYNTALLCERLGDEAVTSIEVDPAVAAQAGDSLERLGYKPTLLVGDGTTPEPADYDLLLSTVAVRHLPAAWLAALRSGGVIVSPWGPGAGFASASLVRLEVGADGVAHGRLIGDAAFMLVRAHRPEPLGRGAFVDEAADGVRDGLIEVNPRVVTSRHPGWTLTLGHLVPGLGYDSYEAATDDDAGEATVYVYDRDGSGSWALGEYTPHGGPFEARWRGPRDLWEEIAAARRTWCWAGGPSRDRLGVTVDESATRLWVDRPEHVLSLGAGP